MHEYELQLSSLFRVLNSDPCNAQVFQVNCCGPSFDTWWLEDSAEVLLQAAKERAVIE